MIYRHDTFLIQHQQLKIQAVERGNTNGWNLLCFTRESSSGNTHLFWHGKGLSSANKYIYPGHTIRKGGKIAVAGQVQFRSIFDRVRNPIGATKNLPLTISQVNVWDRKLTQDEVAVMSGRQKCDGGIGNVLDWEDLKSQLALNKFTVTQNSQCSTISGSIF